MLAPGKDEEQLVVVVEVVVEWDAFLHDSEAIASLAAVDPGTVVLAYVPEATLAM